MEKVTAELVVTCANMMICSQAARICNVRGGILV